MLKIFVEAFRHVLREPVRFHERALYDCSRIVPRCDTDRWEVATEDAAPPDLTLDSQLALVALQCMLHDRKAQVERQHLPDGALVLHNQYLLASHNLAHPSPCQYETPEL